MSAPTQPPKILPPGHEIKVSKVSVSGTNALVKVKQLKNKGKVCTLFFTNRTNHTFEKGRLYNQ